MQKSRKLILWEALNSSFALWLLSVVFVGGFSRVYADYQSHKREEEQVRAEARESRDKKEEKIDRLAMEFSYRRSKVLVNLSIAGDSPLLGEVNYYEKSRDIALHPLTEIPNEKNPPLFDDFRSHTGFALLAEISTLVDGGEKLEIDEMIFRLTNFVLDRKKFGIRSAIDYKRIAGEFLKRSDYPRWRTGFIYNDCKQNNPFC